MGVMRHMVYRSYVFKNAHVSKYILLAMAIILGLYVLMKFAYKAFALEDVLFITFFTVSVLALNKMLFFKYDSYDQSMAYLALSALELILIKSQQQDKKQTLLV